MIFHRYQKPSYAYNTGKIETLPKAINLAVRILIYLCSCHYLSLKSLTVNDPGARTFGVLTKLDLMDKGTNALDVIFLSPSTMFPVLLFML
ncbi:hypothetical protein ACSQ67_009981 [Phaseolus vulgaris]